MKRGSWAFSPGESRTLAIVESQNMFYYNLVPPGWGSLWIPTYATWVSAAWSLFFPFVKTLLSFSTPQALIFWKNRALQMCLPGTIHWALKLWLRRMDERIPEAGHSAASFPSENHLQQEGFWRWDLTWKQMSVPCLSNPSFSFWGCRKCSVHPLLADMVAK